VIANNAKLVLRLLMEEHATKLRLNVLKDKNMLQQLTNVLIANSMKDYLKMELNA